MNTFRRTIRGKLVESRTDWMLCSRHNLAHSTTHMWTEHSDHCAILSVLQVPNQQPRATHLKIPCAERAFALCAQLEEESLTVEEFYERHRVEARKQQHMKKIRLSLKQKLE